MQKRKKSGKPSRVEEKKAKLAKVRPSKEQVESEYKELLENKMSRSEIMEHCKSSIRGKKPHKKNFIYETLLQRMKDQDATLSSWVANANQSSTAADEAMLEISNGKDLDVIPNDFTFITKSKFGSNVEENLNPTTHCSCDDCAQDKTAAELMD